MNKLLICSSWCGLLLLAASCQKTIENPTVASDACAPAQPVLRTIRDAEGDVTFDPLLREHCISPSISGPGGLDSTAIGVLCGLIPEPLQRVNSKVVFSGVYNAYAPSLTGVPSRTRYYYLVVSQAKVELNVE